MGNVQGNRRTNMGAVHENPLNRGKRRARKSAKQIWATCMKILQTDMGNVHESLLNRGKRCAWKSAKQIWATCMKIC